MSLAFTSRGPRALLFHSGGYRRRRRGLQAKYTLANASLQELLSQVFKKRARIEWAGGTPRRLHPLASLPESIMAIWVR